MNLRPITNVSEAAKPEARTIDITVSDPARPEALESGDAGKPSPQIGTIKGVLTAEESRAIESLFAPLKEVYTARGAARSYSIPGNSLDLQA